MNGRRRGPDALQTAGCLGLLLILFLFCLLPLVFVEAMQVALAKLDLTRQAAFAAALGIVLGSFLNIPLYRIGRHEDQVVDFLGVIGTSGWLPRFRWVRRDTIVAVNVGGCMVPAAIGVWEAMQVFRVGGWPVAALAIAATANIVACYLAARPVRGVGIMMPGFLSPIVAVGAAWLLLPEAGPEVRAPVAFVAGILGPIVGADLLHLKDITKVSVGMLSIGGAGTFDGIVLSGILAALLA